MGASKSNISLVGMLAAAATGATALADSPQRKPPGDAAMKPADRAAAQTLLDTWPAGPRLAGTEMIAKYGAPQEVTSERMIWRDAGPYKRIMLTREELPHDFPIAHKDYLEHTISFNVPPQKTDEVHAFDASITIYRVGGELSARCDLESNNVLTLNLAKDIIAGDKTVEAARKEFGDAVMARTLGKPPASTVALQFKPQQRSASADPEAVTIPGAPLPATAAGARASADNETLAMLIALDHDEVHAAMAAKERKQLPKAVRDYAQMLHTHHGKHVQDTVQLGLKQKLAPRMSPAVDALHAKNASALAKVVALEDDAFARGFLDLMIAGHTDAIQLLDERTARVQTPAVKTHLAATRQVLTTHLQQAKTLRAQIGSARTSSR